MSIYVECSQCQTRMDLISFAKVTSGKNPEFWLCRFICPNCYYVDAYSISKMQGDWMFRTKKCYTLWYFWVMKGRRERNRKLLEEEKISEVHSSAIKSLNKHRKLSII